MNVLFIGGSNTLMKEGYAEVLSRVIQAQYPQATITNLAVGANSCVHGLEVSCTVEDYKKYDVVFLEYVVNDYKLSGAKYIETWKRAYEALIRRIRIANPSARIISIMLGRRSETAFTRQDVLKAYVQKLGTHYGCLTIDVDAYLKKLVGNNFDAFRALYLDEGHIRRPEVSEVAANYIRQCMERDAIDQFTAILPTPLRKPTFETPHLLHFHSLAQDNIEIFQNSRMTVKTLKLAVNEELVCEIPGNAISLSYISTAQSGSLLIAESGMPNILIDTAHSSVRDGRLKFILKSFVFPNKDWSATVEKRTVTLKCVSLEDRQSHIDSYEKEYGMSIEEKHKDISAIYLNAIMYN